MKKNITKEQIIEVALDMMRDTDHIRSTNLREIARTLGCAHTNLYNYFSSYTGLLWEAHITMQKNFMQILMDKLLETEDYELKMKYFFTAFLDMYLNYKGWFRLAWIDYIGESRPENDEIATEQTTEALTTIIGLIWHGLYSTIPPKDETKRVLHNTHCYIIGVVSNFIAGRGLQQDEADLKDYVVKQAINIFTLCLGRG